MFFKRKEEIEKLERWIKKFASYFHFRHMFFTGINNLLRKKILIIRVGSRENTKNQL